MHGVAADQAAIFGLDSRDPIHRERASASAAAWTSDKTGRNFGA